MSKLTKERYAYRTVRRDWLEHLANIKSDFCWICREPGTDVEHMMHGRAKTRHALTDLATFCWLCHKCHMNLNVALNPLLVKSTMPVVHQRFVALLKLKKTFDPQHYDRAHVLKLYGYGERYVHEAEVDL